MTSLQPYYPTSQVLRSSDFFWVGRGGFGITHKGNAAVRKMISAKSAEYTQMKRCDRHLVAKQLLNEDLSQIKFVTPRNTILTNLEADDAKHASGKQFTRRVGLLRREALMKMHNSIEQIRSYPEDVCIEVGYAWTLDVVNHQLREDADIGRKAAKPSAKRGASLGNNQQPSKKRRAEPALPSANFGSVFEPILPNLAPTRDDSIGSLTASMESLGRVFDFAFSSQTPATDEGADLTTSAENLGRVFDFALPDQEPTREESVGSLFATLFPEEHSAVEKRQKMAASAGPRSSGLGEQDETDVSNFFDGMFNSVQSVDAVSALLAVQPH